MSFSKTFRRKLNSRNEFHTDQRVKFFGSIKFVTGVNLACSLHQFGSVNNALDIRLSPPEFCSAMSFVNGSHGK